MTPSQGPVSVRGTQRITDQKSRKQISGARAYAHDLTESARQAARTGDRPRRRDRRVMQVPQAAAPEQPVLIGERESQDSSWNASLKRSCAATCRTSSKNKKMVARPRLHDRGTKSAANSNASKPSSRKSSIHGEIICSSTSWHIRRRGSAEGAIDAANLLKPALGAANCAALGATTSPNTRMHVERRLLSPALPPCDVGEPTGDEHIASSAASSRNSKFITAHH